ncbi:DUF418 domain-containing protein [Nonomuraea sp. NPDC005501]|uniref:DUF418 domain-containing protein n=1 Tax=Nonomuraea sp. NPDC005501 TaxID=3156884 RepID=UPI0033BCC752
MPPEMSPEAPSPAPGRPRIAALDVVRGFALCGILLANVQPIANTGPALGNPTAVPMSAWMGLFVEQRFFPIFSLLFGVGFSLLLRSAGERVERPRLLLLRRLLTLLAIGLVHMFLLWRGDILSIYAAVGLVVLLPSTWLPRWVVAGLSPVLLVAALLGNGGPALVPGLFLLGSALVRYGVVDRIESSAKGPAAIGLVLLAGAVPALWAQESHGPGPVAVWFPLAGLLLAGVYVCALMVLLRTPLRPALRAVFAPLGRMALTNYLTATLLVLAASRLLHVEYASSWTAVYVTAGVVLPAQWLASALWLRRYRQGPMEWLWRWATWGSRPPFRRHGG